MIELIYVLTVVLCVIFFTAFTFVVMFGAPFLPTLSARVPEALDMIDLEAGQTLIELGSGDGRILKAAAERGWKVIGYELNPLLVIYSKITTLRYGRNVRVVWGNFWRSQWPPADGIFVFLLQPYMEKLDKKIMQDYPKGVKLVSFAFKIPGKKPAYEKNGLYLYRYGD